MVVETSDADQGETATDMADLDTNNPEPLQGAIDAELRGARPLSAGATDAQVHDPAHEGHIEAELPRLKTYADDLSDEMKRKGSTLSSIVQAEQERTMRTAVLNQEEPVNIFARWKNQILLAGTIVLGVVGVLAVGAGLYFSIWGSMPKPEPTPSIIFPNRVEAFVVPNYDTVPNALASERERASLALGEIERMDLTLEGATTSTQTLLETLNPPPGLLREARSVMFGLHSFDRNQPFIIIEITQYDRAYGAMLAWEEDIGRSLGNFFKPLKGTAPPTTLFKDVVFENIDLRVSQESWPILYAFPRRDVLVITTNRHTLQEILTRLNAQQVRPMVP